MRISWKRRAGPLNRERTRSRRPLPESLGTCVLRELLLQEMQLGAGKEWVQARISWTYLRQPEGENLQLWVLSEAKNPQLERSLGG